ncbi:hypothetical protein [Phocaeicola coprocola]|uniref:hypothetical protein n=1 Tax=Phocaeicola coprocola TaxID=310298 RepID=UPI0040287FA6
MNCIYTLVVLANKKLAGLVWKGDFYICIGLSACLPEFILNFLKILYEKEKNIIMFSLKDADKF